MSFKKRLTFFIAFLTLVISPCIASAGSFTAGAASVDITPDLTRMKVPSSGYGDRGKAPMEGVHDPVHCKALVVSDGQGSAAIVTCDLIGVSPDLRRKVVDKLSGSIVGAENLMMTASHTHSGPGAMQDNVIANLVFGKYNEALTDKTAELIAGAIRKAESEMVPAAVKAGTADVLDVTRNRRDPAMSYNYLTRRFNDSYDSKNPENLVDPQVTVLLVESEDGRPIAVLFNFATHGTVLGSSNMLISADWPGVTQRTIEATYPGAVALFVNGAIGDQAPAMIKGDDIDDFEYLEVIGNKVAKGVARAIDNAAPIEATPVSSVFWKRAVPPGKNASVEGIMVPSWFVKANFPSVPLQTIRMGDAALMGVPVEMVSEIGLAMKSGAKGHGVKYPIVAGLANDIFFYCATAEDFSQGGYEVGLTIYGEIEAGMLIGEQMLMVGKLMRD